MARLTQHGLRRVVGPRAPVSPPHRHRGPPLHYPARPRAPITDLATQLLLVVVGIALVFSPEVLFNNVHLGVAPTWKSALIAIPIGMIAYTGIETISNMAEEARDETRTVPAAIRGVVGAVFAIYAALPLVALSALPVHRDASGHYSTLLGTSEAHGGVAGAPPLRLVKHLHPRALPTAGEG